MAENRSSADVSSGIDRRASLNDIKDAFVREGLTLTVREVDGRFEATIGHTLSTSSPSEPVTGASPGEAAHRAWTGHLRRNGGIGQS